MSPDSPDARYTHGHEESVLASHRARTAANSCGYLLPHLHEGMSVLDVGCGPGSITLDLAGIVREGRVVGIDNVEKPLVAARQAAEARGDTTTVFHVSDVAALPFPDDAFDVVHAHQVLQHLSDPVRALREMQRVSRGLVAVRDADYAAMAWYPSNDGMERWRSTYRTAAKRNEAEPDAGRHLRQWARLAGLQHVRITTSVWTYADPESCRWWGNSQADRVSGAVFREQAREQGLTDGEVTAMAQAWRDWTAEEDAWFALPHGELLAGDV